MRGPLGRPRTKEFLLANRTGWTGAYWIAIGTALGVAIGAMYHKIGVGIAIGVGLGVALAAIRAR